MLFFLSKIKEAVLRRKSKSSLNFISLREAKQGQIVEVEFHDPRKLGLQSPNNNQLTITRFNRDELENRIIVGFVKKIANWEGGPGFGWYINIESRKGDSLREYLFLEHEIKSIRVLS